MKIRIIISAFYFLSILSCKNTPRQETDKLGTPAALQEKSSSAEIILKRTTGDLVESLYEELAEKTPALKELEVNISDINDHRIDSTALFDNYNEKNEAYYRSANNHLEQITDTVLKQRMKLLISDGQARYNGSVSQFVTLLKGIDAKTATLNDLHAILKITKTLPVIEKYQRENKPSTKPLEGFKEDVEKTIKMTDTLLNSSLQRQ